MISVLVVYESSLLIGSIRLNHNGYKDVLQLTLGCTVALYAVCFIAKKLEKWRIGKVLELCGRESFYIMGLHIVGFKLCTMILMSVGVINGGLENLMTPQIGNNVFLLIVYTLCDMFFPIAFYVRIQKNQHIHPDENPIHEKVCVVARIFCLSHGIDRRNL